MSRNINILRAASILACLLVLAACKNPNPLAPPPPTPVPATPPGVTATAGNTQNTITWNATTYATSYNIYTASSAANAHKGNINATKIIVGNVSTYNHTGLTNGTTYYYVVTAQNINGESAESSQVSATPMATLPPTVTTGAAGTITPTTATLNGTVNPNGFSTTWAFQWGTTTGYGSSTASQAAGAGTLDVSVSANLNSLTPGTTYHFRLVAQNANGATYGLDQSFTTPTPPPAPTGVTATPGSGQNIISWNPVSGATSYNIYWSTTTGVNKTNGTKITGVTSPYPHTGLTNGTTYYYVVTAVDANGESTESSQVSATPMPTPPPAAVTGAASSLTSTTATLNGTVNPNGFSTTWAFQWGTTTGYGSSTASQAAGAGTLDVPVSANLSGLTPGTTYHFRLVAQNANGTTYGLDQSFATPTPPSPPTGVTATPGSGQNIISWNPVSGATSYNIYWSTTTGVNKTNGTKITGATSPYPHTGLTNGTTYYYVVTAVDANGESSESSQVSATPMPTPPPAAVTGAANGIASTTATLNGTVNPNGFNTTWAFQWGTTTGYGSSTASQSAGAGTLDVPVSANLNSLTPGTTYHFRLVAQNANGTTYGLDQSFSTLAMPAPPSGVTATASDGANTITWNSVPAATSYNIYWSTTTGVNKANGTKITGATSPYPHTGLTNGTIYYYVVTAQNGVGESAESSQASAMPNKISIDGRLYGGYPGPNALVSVLNNGATVATAAVTINGTTLAYNGTNSDYEATMTVTAGASYTITVTIPGDTNTYTTTGTMFTTYPTITTPASGFSWGILSAHTIIWNQGAPTAGPPTPFNEVALLRSSNNTYLYPSTGTPKQIPLNNTFTIPAGSISLSIITAANLYVGISQSTAIPNSGSGGAFTMTGFSPAVPGTITLLF